MPHIIVKLRPGQTEEKKQELTAKIVESVLASLGTKEEVISVAFEEIAASEWKDKVYDSDITNGTAQLYRKPGYAM